MDDIAILVEGKSCEQNSTILSNLHEKICKPWARRHGSKFAPEKSQLSHITKKRTTNLEAPLYLPEQTIQPPKTIIYLGVLLDTKLS